MKIYETRRYYEVTGPEKTLKYAVVFIGDCAPSECDKIYGVFPTIDLAERYIDTFSIKNHWKIIEIDFEV